MNLEHPTAFSGETVVSTPNIDLVVKDSVNLPEVLRGQEVVGLSSVAQDEVILSGTTLFFPAVSTTSAELCADIRYRAHDSPAAALTDRSITHATIVHEGIASHDQITVLRTDNEQPGLLIRLAQADAFIRLSITPDETQSTQAIREIKLSAVLPPELDDASLQTITHTLHLLWGASIRGIQMGQQLAPIVPLRLVIEQENHKDVSHLLEILDTHITRHDNDELNIVPWLDVSFDEITALNDAYQPSSEQFERAIYDLEASYRARREACIDSEDTSPITIARIAQLLELLNRS